MVVPVRIDRSYLLEENVQMTKSKILVDLKPALDGFAGIPQESRILFGNLRRMQDEFEVHGLLQHGTGLLQSNNAAQYDSLPLAEKTIMDSEIAACLGPGIEVSYFPRLPKGIQHRIHNEVLRWRAMRQSPLPLGAFQSDKFTDLLWQALFSKALAAEDKEFITGSRFRIIAPARQHMHNIMLHGPRLIPARQYMRVDTSEYDLFIAQTPFPGHVHPNTQMVVRYHDAVPVFMPHTIGDRREHQAMHFHSLKSNVADNAWFACVSEATRQDLLSIFPEAEPRSTVIHNAVLPVYRPDSSSKADAWNIILGRTGASQAGDKPPEEMDYLLMVSTIEPRKNHELLISAWEKLRRETGRDIKLVLVGNQGWHCEPVLARMQPWLEKGDLIHLSKLPASDLRTLYRHAAATICPSIAEGFDYSGAEAMSCGGLVLASDIPVHAEILADAAMYFDPYDSDAAAAVFADALADGKVRKQNSMRKTALKRAQAFTPDKLREQWKDFLGRQLNTEIN